MGGGRDEEQCANFKDIESHSYSSGADEGDQRQLFSYIRNTGVLQGSWALSAGSETTGGDMNGCHGGRTVQPMREPWPLGRWSAQTWTMSYGDAQRMYLFSGRLHLQGDGTRAAGLSTDFLLNDLWSLRR